ASAQTNLPGVPCQSQRVHIQHRVPDALDDRVAARKRLEAGPCPTLSAVERCIARGAASGGYRPRISREGCWMFESSSRVSVLPMTLTQAGRRNGTPGMPVDRQSTCGNIVEQQNGGVASRLAAMFIHDADFGAG